MTALSVLIERGAVVPFDDLPPSFAALDGYCAGPRLDPANRRYSFDHHEHCIRMVTHSTCEQVLDAILLGLEVDGLTLGINDVDEDTMLATWLLRHPHLAATDHVRQVIHVAGLRDAHGPAYPLTAAQEEMYSRCRGIFEPLYREWRERTYGTCDLYALMDTLQDRLDRWLIEGELFEPEREDPPAWTLYYLDERMAVVEGSKTAMDLVYRYRPCGISFTRQPDGSTAYTVGRRSDLVPGFDVAVIVSRLAEIEPGWGGGTSIGGAPRHPDGRRSRLLPDEVIAIVRDLIQES